MLHNNVEFRRCSHVVTYREEKNLYSKFGKVVKKPTKTSVELDDGTLVEPIEVHYQELNCAEAVEDGRLYLDVDGVAYASVIEEKEVDE